MKTVAGDHGAAHKGRGATLNPEGRFEKDAREAFDDGWDTPLEEEPGRPRTIVTVERIVPEHQTFKGELDPSMVRDRAGNQYWAQKPGGPIMKILVSCGE